jgi:phasin
MTATPADLDISPDLRAFAEKSVDQAKQAIETLMSSAQRAVSTFEGQAKTARQGAKDLGQKAFSFAERNMASAFELAQRMIRAKDVEEVLRLQADYIRAQTQALAEQAKELGEHTSKIAQDVGKSRS